MPTVAGIAARIEREGESVILQRRGAADLPVTAFVRGYRADELAGAIEQGDREAHISDQAIAAAGWPGPPRKGDKLVIRGGTTTVQSCATTMLRGGVAKHVIQVRG